MTKKKGAEKRERQCIKRRKFIMIIMKEIVPDRKCQNHLKFLTRWQWKLLDNFANGASSSCIKWSHIIKQCCNILSRPIFRCFCYVLHCVPLLEVSTARQFNKWSNEWYVASDTLNDMWCELSDCTTVPLYRHNEYTTTPKNNEFE